MSAREVLCPDASHKRKLIAIVRADGLVEIKTRETVTLIEGATVLRFYCPLCYQFREMRL